MALALCLTLLPATAQAADGHAPHCLCGAEHDNNIKTHEADNKTAFANATWLASQNGALCVRTSSTSSSSTSLPEEGNYVILKDGYYYLSTTADDCDKSCVKTYKPIKIQGNVTICLNGNQIQKAGNTTGPVFEVPSDCTLTLTNCKGTGQIVCNDDSNGSGVYVNGGTLNLYSGQITQSYGQKGTDSNNKYGGGVYVGSGGTFNMYGGDITGNSASFGGGVYVKSGKFEMNGGTIKKNTSSGGSGTLSFGGAGVYVEESGNFIMKNAASVTENTIDYGSTGGAGVYVNGGNFEMNGSSKVATNKVNDSSGTFNGGGVYVGNGGTFTMHNNASVTENAMSNNRIGILNGAGVYVNGGTFTMYNSASVTNNAASGYKNGTGDGGGVYVNGGNFEMNDDATSVSGNTATNYGGGVYVSGKSSTFTMNSSASITGNSASFGGGGVYASSGTFNMNDSSKVTDNAGSGVFVYDSATFIVSASPTVTGNTRDRAASNVYLTGSAKITIADHGLDGIENSIGVTKGGSGVGTLIAIGANQDYSSKFFVDNKQYKVGYDATEEQLVLTAVKHTHSWSYQKVGDATIKAVCTGTPGSCDYQTTPPTVTISMTQSTYTYSEGMDTPTAKLTYDNWPSDLDKADASKIEYYKSADAGTSYTDRVANTDDLKKPGNYLAKLTFHDQNLEVHFSVVKKKPEYSQPKAIEGLTYTGEPQVLINRSQVTGGKMQYSLTSGGLYSDSLPSATDAGTYTVWYKVVGDKDHNDVSEKSIEVTIAKAPLIGTPTFTKVTGAGKTLKDVTLTKPESWPAGTFEWGDGATETSKDTQIVQGQEYPWYFNAENYYATGKIVPWANPSSSGSSSDGSGSSDSNPIIKTETKNNPDGSTTKTETRKDGSVTQTTTAKDGSVSKTETKKDGSSVTENKAADGSTGTIKTDKNGKTEMNAKVSAKAVENAKKNGEPVKAPVEVEASRNSSAAPTVSIELPQNSGKTEVEIPVSNASSGTVAVLVRPDGTEEIIKNSIPTEDGIRLTVDGSATVKIVDNAKGFIDTQNHWAKDEIDFVSARELVNGISATRYAPDATATRAQMWTILARQNDADLSGGANWYEKAQLWSKDKGISDGSNPGATITRAQMVTMLWRTMGQPAATGKVSFADVPAGSYYAQAVAWAVESGITTGIGGGKFDPTATCTRAQIAAFLARSMK